MGKVPDAIVHVLEAQVGSHVFLNVHGGMDDVAGEQAARTKSVELWV